MVALVQHAAETTDSSATATITLGSPTTPGNRLVVVVSSISSAQAIDGITLGGSADNFAQDVTVENTGGAAASIISVWSDPGCAGDQTEIVITFAGSTFSMVDVYEVSGLAASGGPDQTSSQQSGNTGGTTFTSGTTAETADDDEFWVGGVIAVITTSGNPAITGPGSPWTDEAQQEVGSHTSYLSSCQITSSTGEAAYAGTFNSASTYAAVAATYAPASGTAHTATAALTVTPSFSAAPARGHYRTGSLLVAPSFSAARTVAHTRTAALTVTPSFRAVPSGGAGRPAVTQVPAGDEAREFKRWLLWDL